MYTFAIFTYYVGGIFSFQSDRLFQKTKGLLATVLPFVKLVSSSAAAGVGSGAGVVAGFAEANLMESLRSWQQLGDVARDFFFLQVSGEKSTFQKRKEEGEDGFNYFGMKILYLDSNFLKINTRNYPVYTETY